MRWRILAPLRRTRGWPQATVRRGPLHRPGLVDRSGPRAGGAVGLPAPRRFWVFKEPAAPAGEISSPDVDYGTQIHTLQATKTFAPGAGNVLPPPKNRRPATAWVSPAAMGDSPLPAAGSPAPVNTLRLPV